MEPAAGIRGAGPDRARYQWIYDARGEVGVEPLGDLVGLADRDAVDDGPEGAAQQDKTSRAGHSGI